MLTWPPPNTSLKTCCHGRYSIVSVSIVTVSSWHGFSVEIRRRFSAELRILY